MNPYDKTDKLMADIKGLVAALDPESKIKVTRTEALEWWDRARIANNRQIDNQREDE